MDETVMTQGAETANAENEQGVDTATTENTQGDVQAETIDPEVIRAEAQRMADGMVAKKMKSMPSKEDLAAFKQWQESQKTESERQQEQQKQFVELQARLEQAEQDKYLLSKGVPASKLKYYAFMSRESMQHGEDFEVAATRFLEQEPIAQPKEPPVTVDMGAKHTADQPVSGSAKMDQIIRNFAK